MIKYIAILATLVSTCAFAADWPQYRHDAARSGYTSERLPEKLGLRWVRSARHSPRPAWVGRSLARSRMKFDWAYSVVVADGLCFFGSSADDKVYALDAATGKEKWSIFTGGPVRLAPAVADGRVYVASDDGYLHCLSAADGKTLWKLRAGPNNEQVLGNGRMISRWAARGGPAVRDGVVYFAAGVWPIEGVYVYAVDAETGRVLWCNDNSGFLEIDQPHMHCFARGGVASQGYLAVAKDHVLVATGRSVPAVFDRKTGRFIHFNLGRYGGKTPWGTGGGDVVATDSVFFNSGMAFDMATGLHYHPVGKRYWWDPFIRDGRKCHGEFNLGDRQVICITPDGFVRSEGAMLFGSQMTTRTYDARRERHTAEATPRLPWGKKVGDKHHLERIDNATVLKDGWTVKLKSQPESLAVAGDRVVLGMDRNIAVVDAKTKKQAWSADVDGTVYALAVADGCIFASTGKGTIYCFGKPADGAAIVHKPKLPKPYPDDSKAARAARAVFAEPLETRTCRTDCQSVQGTRNGHTTRQERESSHSGRINNPSYGSTSGADPKQLRGFCLDLDCGDGAFAYTLVKRSNMSVISLTRDPAEAELARRKLDAAGVYGVRAAVVVGEPKDLPSYFANLIVSTRRLDDVEKSLQAQGIQWLQRPCGGLMLLGPRGGKIDTGANAISVTMRGELPGAGNWTHNLADAGNTMCSGDEIVRGPLGMLWYQDETQETIDRHGKNPAPLVYRGLLFREGIDSIKCIDAYNGTKRWEVELPGVLAAYREGTQVGAGQIGSTYCIADEVLYVRKEDRCLLLGYSRGKQIGEFTAPRKPDGGRGRWGYLACRDGVLYGGLMNEDYVIKAQHGDGGPRTQKPMDDHLTETAMLFAMDAKTGELKWTFAPKHSIRNNAIAVGKGMVYVIDRPVAEIDQILRSTLKKARRGETSGPKHPTGVLLALDSETGKVRWRDENDIFGTTLAVSTEHDVLLMGYNHIGFARASDWPGGMRAYRASTGKLLWESKQSSMRPAIVGRTIYSFPYAWDLLTGEQKTTAEPLADREKGSVWKILGKGQGCGLVAASKNLLTLRSASLSYYDLTYDKGWLEYYGGLRAGCFINAIPAGGIVVAPDDTRACRCSYQNQATIALIRHGVRPPVVEPQPGQTNFKYVSIAREPFFTDDLTVVMSHPRRDVEIRYTLDDTYPTSDSTLYTKPITIDKTTPIRAAVFRDGKKLAERDVVRFTRREKPR